MTEEKKDTEEKPVEKDYDENGKITFYGIPMFINTMYSSYRTSVFDRCTQTTLCSNIVDDNGNEGIRYILGEMLGIFSTIHHVGTLTNPRYMLSSALSLDEDDEPNDRDRWRIICGYSMGSGVDKQSIQRRGTEYDWYVSIGVCPNTYHDSINPSAIISELHLHLESWPKHMSRMCAYGLFELITGLAEDYGANMATAFVNDDGVEMVTINIGMVTSSRLQDVYKTHHFDIQFSFPLTHWRFKVNGEYLRAPERVAVVEEKPKLLN